MLDSQREEKVNMELDLILAAMRARISWNKQEIGRLNGEIETLEDQSYEKIEDIKTISKKLESFELLANFDDERPSDKVKKEIELLDGKLKSINKFLSKDQFEEQNERRHEWMKKHDEERHEISKQNTSAFHKLRSDMSVLKNTLRQMDLGD